MAKIFLDTNYFIDTIHRHPEKEILSSLLDHFIYASTLSVHIYCYVFKIKIPNEHVENQIKKFQLVDLSSEILEKSLKNPLSDLEDNIQLHSAAEADCDLFLTSDKKLLDMKFFGKMMIAASVKESIRD